AVTSLAAQVESLNKKLDLMTSSKVAAITTCHGCGGVHASSDCPISIGGATTDALSASVRVAHK
uniref:hypothetical protein n=1 Tax=Bartonella sp. CL1QHWL TaxID=3243517 RepID=UPI0035D0C1B6